MGEALDVLLVQIPRKIPRRAWVLLLLAWTATLLGLSYWNGPKNIESRTFSFFWNFSHSVCFGLLVPLTLYSLDNRTHAEFRLKRSSVVISLAVVIVLGICTEWIQSYRPNRTASVFDVLTDLAGGLSLLSLYLLVARKKISLGIFVVWVFAAAILCCTPAYFDTFG